MKKYLIFTILLFSILTSCSEVNKKNVENLTMKNVDVLISKIEDICNEYNYRFEKDEIIETKPERNITIFLNDKETISVYFNNMAYKSKKGDSLVDFTYESQSNSLNDEFFIKVVNIASKYELTDKIVNKFLTGDEKSYPPEKFNYKKLADEKIKKATGEYSHHWELIYSEFIDGSVCLEYGGLTK